MTESEQKANKNLVEQLGDVTIEDLVRLAESLNCDVAITLRPKDAPTEEEK